MMKWKKLLAVSAAALLAVMCVGCGSPSEPEPPSEDDGSSAETPKREYVYEGTSTAAPYTVFHSDGTAAAQPFNSMFAAIRYAGENASNADPMPVRDANGLEIFRRQGTTQSWCYDGTNYVGSMPQKEALDWAYGRARSYVYNGRGTAFVYVGTEYPTDGRPPSYEQGASGYSYLRTPSGDNVSGEWVTNGYSYASGTVRLSEATYFDAPDSQWNAYIFFNVSTVSENCDLGIGMFGTSQNDPRYVGMDGQWKIIHNCTHASHKNGEDADPSFRIWDQTVTTMKKDPETGIYSGADDLLIEAIGGRDTWTLR
ncbi:MAG: hypothetical protein K2H43_04530, partial [Clostridia bacterium]|nr:hypothetical protein [Clostridia bacterium]